MSKFETASNKLRNLIAERDSYIREQDERREREKQARLNELNADIATLQEQVDELQRGEEAKRERERKARVAEAADKQRQRLRDLAATLAAKDKAVADLFSKLESALAESESARTAYEQVYVTRYGSIVQAGATQDEAINALGYVERATPQYAYAETKCNLGVGYQTTLYRWVNNGDLPFNQLKDVEGCRNVVLVIRK